ncbi:MAG: glycosyltransferase family 2 protein [Candidatus Berkiellales bacterium]
MKPVIIIPAYQPDQELSELIQKLSVHPYPIIIVNDGSGKRFLPIFSELEKHKQVTVLHHQKNRGKGQALKTGFQYFLDHYPISCTGVITADADGQHIAEDIIQVATFFTHHPHALCLGCRMFQKNAPWRSRFGNMLTRKIFRWLVNSTLQDTQTGLRAIPRDILPLLIKIKSRAYDFELDMLLQIHQQNILIREIPIQAIYKNGNSHSHFNPILDSLKIYFVLVRFQINKFKSKFPMGWLPLGVNRFHE